MPRHKSTAAPTSKSHKRQPSTPTTATPGSRSSKRLKQSAATNTPSTGKEKSKFFYGPSSDDDDEISDVNAASESGYEDAATSSAASDPPSEDEEDYESEAFDAPPKRSKKRGPGRGASRLSAGAADVDAQKELWRPGVKAGLGPGKQVFIEKPKPRGDGGIKYEPRRIHPNTMSFLGDLRENNDREWLKSECVYWYLLGLLGLAGFGTRLNRVVWAQTLRSGRRT